jgi:predicted phage terminase large subunit-like protein
MEFANRHEAAAHYSELFRIARKESETAAIRLMAELGRRDLFFLLTRIIGRKDMDQDWHFARCQDVQQNPDGMLDLWAREHYKSTIITFGLTIQNILVNPEITVGIFSHTRPIAKGFLAQIKYELEQNEVLKRCYPEVLWESPKRESPRWSADNGIVVRRKKNPKEATVEAWGLVDCQPTGKHFEILVYDDVVTRDSVSTPEMISKVTECWALSLNLGMHRGRQRYIGTRYHFNDTYKTIIERQGAEPRIYAATENGNADGVPMFLAPEDLAKKRRQMGPYVFGCQMLQDPKADSVQGFKEEWLRYWQPLEPAHWEGMNRYIVIDPAGEKKAGSDYTVMLVIGLAEDGNYYLIGGVRDRMNLTERAACLFSLHRQYRPTAVGYERYGMQADIEHLRFEMQSRNYRFDVVELGGAVPKKDRIGKLVPLFEQGRLYLPVRSPFRDQEGTWRDLTKEFVSDEYMAFPVSTHDDMLDCMARILEPVLAAEFPSPLDMCAEQTDLGNMEYDLYA